MGLTGKESLRIEEYFRNVHESSGQLQFHISISSIKGVGSSWVQRRLCYGEFADEWGDPFGDGPDRKVFMHHGRRLTVECDLVLGYDPADDDRLRLVKSQQVRGADAFVMVYDLTDRASFEALPDLQRTIRRAQGDGMADPGKPTAVIANKSDLPEETWAVTHDEGVRYSDRIGALFAQGSAKTGSGLSWLLLVRIIDRVVLARVGSEAGGSRGKRSASEVVNAVPSRDDGKGRLQRWYEKIFA